MFKIESFLYHFAPFIRSYIDYRRYFCRFCGLLYIYPVERTEAPVKKADNIDISDNHGIIE